MMTGLSKKGDIVTGLDVGADEYLVKPVDFDILAARMRSVQRIASIQDKLSDRLSLWVTRIATTRHPNVAAVAMANKTVRIAWAIIRKGCDYQPELAAA
jgi:DNA-binding response OmpR family regulator